ncbi:MAG TPA: hypothetical protein VHG93_14580 [Longimicrobium sp.]|nr:hypothetical protein [Longimicrobium sp.]
MRVILDVYSGRPNPTFTLSQDQAREVLRTIEANRSLMSEGQGVPGRLGLRGLIIEPPRALRQDLPARFRIPAPDGPGAGKAAELIQDIVARANDVQPRQPAGARPSGLDYSRMDLAGLVRRELDRLSRRPPRHEGGAGRGGVIGHMPPAPVLGTDAAGTQTIAAGGCQAEVTPLNLAFWNVAPVQEHNNCYNYATNRRTDTFAQPGRAAGAEYHVHTCADVTAAATADGAVFVPHCAPDGQAPRWHMALVIWPDPDGDFHWYREAQGGVWGHKPGEDAATDLDAAGHVIHDPQTADRGPYTDFCSYCFAPSGMGIA